MRIGELCAGYGGLGMGVQAVLGGELAWVSEYEPPSKANPNPKQGAARILAHRFPGVPNLGDMTTVDWSAVDPVDILTGGTPCQDLSAAGKRAGMTEGTRSNLWVSMREAVAVLRPSLVVWENVRGAYSAPADSDLESREGRVGVRRDGPVLRALGRVLGDLSELGFDAEWIGIRAADVGAPHGRFRVFVTAWPAQDTNGAARDERWLTASRPAESGRARADAGGRDRAPAAYADSHALREQSVALTRSGGAAIVGLAGADAAADAHHGADDGQRARQEPRGGGATAADADRDGLGRLEELHGVPRPGRESGGDGHDADGLALDPGGVDWGAYGPAVRRWERLTRPAPNPTERGKNGQPRLSPAFVEWMQGLPAGWVTDVPGLTRNEQLKALGNGVVPQQAAAALRLLLPDVAERAA